MILIPLEFLQRGPSEYALKLAGCAEHFLRYTWGNPLVEQLEHTSSMAPELPPTISQRVSQATT